MTQRPAVGAFVTDGALADQGEKRQAFEDMNQAGREQPGGDVIEKPSINAAVRISGGAITPKSATVRVDTEGSASSDDLDTINVTNHPDGRHLFVGIVDSGRHVNLIHNPGGGTGALDLSNFGALDLELNNTTMWAHFVRDGSVWLLVNVWGREDFHELDAAGEPALQGSWSQGTPLARFWRDANADVRWEGSIDWTGNVLGPFPNPAWTMEAGYRPGSQRVFLVGVRDIGGSEDPVLETLRFEADGSVVLGMNNIGSFTGTPRVYLDGVTYRAEQ